MRDKQLTDEEFFATDIILNDERLPRDIEIKRVSITPVDYARYKCQERQIEDLTYAIRVIEKAGQSAEAERKKWKERCGSLMVAFLIAATFAAAFFVTLLTIITNQ